MLKQSLVVNDGYMKSHVRKEGERVGGREGGRERGREGGEERKSERVSRMEGSAWVRECALNECLSESQRE